MRITSLLGRLVSSVVFLATTVILPCAGTDAQTVKLNSAEATVVIEPYTPNIVPVSISLLKPYAEASPGYGIIAKPIETGWKRE